MDAQEFVEMAANVHQGQLPHADQLKTLVTTARGILHEQGLDATAASRPKLKTSTPEERAREAAQALARALNEMSFDVEAFADELLREHRTIQQTAFGAFLATVRAWAEQDRKGCYDPRNEFTVKKSRQIVELLGEYNLRVPYI